MRKGYISKAEKAYRMRNKGGHRYSYDASGVAYDQFGEPLEYRATVTDMHGEVIWRKAGPNHTNLIFDAQKKAEEKNGLFAVRGPFKKPKRRSRR